MKKNNGSGINFRLLLKYMRLPLCVFIILAVLAASGILMIRSELLNNAYETGTALAASCAAEEEGNLNVYETLLSFGTASIESRLDNNESIESIADFATMYFERLDTVIGEGLVDPYMVMDGKIIAANPWKGDSTYDYENTPWFSQALEADGDVIFTHVYTDAIYGRPVITAAQSCGNGRAVMAFDILPQRLIFDTAKLRDDESFFLCDSSGTIIYMETDLKLSGAEIQDYLTGIVGKIQSGEMDDNSVIRDLDGSRRGVYYARMDNGWYSIITIPYRNILGNLLGVTLALMLMFAVSFIAMMAFTWKEVRLNEGIRRANETSQVLGNTYYALYRVDYERETYEMIKGSEYVRSRIPVSGSYDRLLTTAGEVIEAEAFKDFTESFSCDNIRELVNRKVRDFGGEFLRLFGDEYRWVSVRILFDSALAPEEVVLCFREVEQEKQRQLQERKLLEESLKLARQNEESKQAFFRNMSHDMRTPLNAILGYSELAVKKIDDREKIRDYLTKIDTSGRYLLGLINDILDMARMEQGQVQLENKRFDLRECLEECVSPFRMQAERSGKTLAEELKADNTVLMGDSFRIQQVLNNLLSNAFKFTPEGGTISLLVHQLDGGDYAKYEFIVSDTGIGMSKDFLKRIFEPYAREMRFSDRQASGTGLGMSITKNLISQMGGEINVESEPGKGSRFTVILPLTTVDEPAETKPENKESEAKRDNTDKKADGLRILLAEDNEINMEITTEILKSQGYIVTQAWDGQEAVEAFSRSKPFEFDAVLMDMQMPRMDGCEAAKTIRAMRREDAGKVPIIAVTANAFAEDISATTAAGMNAHISKPIDLDALKQTLERLIKR